MDKSEGIIEKGNVEGVERQLQSLKSIVTRVEDFKLQIEQSAGGLPGKPRFSKGVGFLRGNRRKKAGDSRKHNHRRGARLHLDIADRRRPHRAHKNIQQNCVEFRGRRNPRTVWRPSGRLRQLPQPPPPPNLPTPGRTSPRVHAHRSLSVWIPAKKNCRARKPQTTSRKSWSRFPQKTRRTVSSWSNPSANSGKT